jgi:ribosomal protein S18 acetylase RimI-like enzyme
MTIDLRKREVIVPELPTGYCWQEWHPHYLEHHAAVKFKSFHTELDANIFPSLSTQDGCRRLMWDISTRQTFIPESTWLIHQQKNQPTEKGQFCATIQGIGAKYNWGAIQNVGVTPAERGCGLGKLLVLKALRGFQLTGIEQVFLEVTSDNFRAIALYEKIGFRIAKMIYRTQIL